MKTLIVYKSIHRRNTEKIAKVMAETMGADLFKVEDIRPEDVAAYELIGFGSGIYNDQFHKDLIRFVGEMPLMERPVFIFSTAAVLKDTYHGPMKEKLAEKGCKVIGEFACPGEFIPLRLNMGRELPGVLVVFSGKNQGRPNTKDLDNARTFANDMIKSTAKTPIT